ncbi:TTK protein kinase Mph1 [Schizosaccharomyces cryophilus OY26]|uniref:TTK protein kinase Mph1 n=1 Tax=Schizosaccharomyces cryophilus (strain OY26 / ATCC MYA-4695 / CBS 11777 / NBRC 106824 / NRRL Y48691) TaxID=653667 RepID=S9VT64_SCHCR|nr:TTK protein kinase Mph1 [Schizosaccharomyces cryophilus OY26]EPY51063.1 TTK protein kinase Mph1 [Schizosaccharomyces cryophilus OY26]
MSNRDPLVTNIADLVSDSSFDEESLSFLEDSEDQDLSLKNDTFSSKSAHSDGTVISDNLRRRSSDANTAEKTFQARIKEPELFNLTSYGTAPNREVKSPAFQPIRSHEHIVTPMPAQNSMRMQSMEPQENESMSKTHNKTPGSLSVSRWRRIGRIGLGPPKRAEYTLSSDVKVPSELKPMNHAIDDDNDNDVEMKSSENSTTSPFVLPTQASNFPSDIQAGSLPNAHDVPMRATVNPAQFEESLFVKPHLKELASDKSSAMKAPSVPLQHRFDQQEQLHGPPPKMNSLVDPSHNNGIPKFLQDVATVANLPFIKLGIVGKGGSSTVFRIYSPENGRLYALKEVSFLQADYSTIQGYKNEIALLRKLSGNDRIVKLYAAEANNSIGQLNMVMEYGETDLAKLLNKYATKPINLNFIRMYWEQMLQAVQIVHEQNIVHSDLKPANFLLVEGSLKLIDFGIAKAIGNDTTNIHRDSHVGTINYMAPEALTDMNANTNLGVKLVKLGRPSDVWSLGCILYQMVYGRAPFAHLKMIQAIAAIPDERHQIQFPEIAVPPSANFEPSPNVHAHGVVVGPDLMDVMKRCLQRDQKKRLTIPELLMHPFLNPVPSFPSHNPQRNSLSSPDSNTHSKLMTAMSASQLSMIIERSIELSKRKSLPKELIDSMAYDCISNLQKMPR